MHLTEAPQLRPAPRQAQSPSTTNRDSNDSNNRHAHTNRTKNESDARTVTSSQTDRPPRQHQAAQVQYLPPIRTQLPHHSLRMVKAGLEFFAGTVDASSVSAMADSADWCLSPLAMPHQPTSITSLCQSASPIPSGFGTNYPRWVVPLGKRGMGINSSKGRDKGMVWVQVAQVIVQQMTGLVE
ncbi:predicted protein [Histoplasma capsulatum G186AR]|uniref:Uncharacterized protein n=2 Tax=Ajellomyces capsulatus TaxID=5037 RepID=C0NLH1_AJECG|nr:uncharacterized protein HCBG_04351 [Histoplasma capsulatum G186AR]EEH07472.1 predicted protein [Histoplasma capsulatum G186AR]KAG5304377.1 hypothetical protein I7I52_02692 [Histoplasma capsulatum]QSS69975.1 hypothetical protein I7I50_11454 [Histoplasma capsulatum G186AR]